LGGDGGIEALAAEEEVIVRVALEERATRGLGVRKCIVSIVY
jgi:hypothetical protein